SVAGGRRGAAADGVLGEENEKHERHENKKNRHASLPTGLVFFRVVRVFRGYLLARSTRAAAARSTSSSVVKRPTLRRPAPRPSSGGTPIACNTGDRQTLPS